MVGGQARVTVVRRGDVSGAVTLPSAGESVDDLLVERVPLESVTEADAPTEVPTAWDHPHLVKVVEAEGRRRGELLAHVPGGSVSALLAARGPLPVGEAVTLLVPVARALAHLHRHGAVHGDVSPDNVLFDAEGAPMLVDPGLARALGEARAEGGTEGFSAPEAVHGRGADVFGWGALAWLVLTGEAPGEERDRVPLPLLRQDVDAAAARLIEDCLAADPQERPHASDVGPALLECHKATPLDATAAAGGDGVPLLRTRAPAQPRWRRLLRRRRPGGAGRVTRPDELGRTRGRGTARRATVWVVGAASAVAVAAAVVTVVTDGGTGNSRAPATATHDSGVDPTAGRPAPTRVADSGGERVQAAMAALPELDKQRTAALSERRAGVLDSVYVDGEGLKADRALISGLRSRGTHFVSLTSSLKNLRPAGEDGQAKVRVLATSVTTGTEVKLSEQTTPRAAQTPRERELAFTLVLAAGQWRIESVTVADAGDG